MSRPPTDDRLAASELIGVVLLFAFVFTAATFTFYFGMQASESIQQQTRMETAETTMTEVQDRMASLASSNDDGVERFDLDSSAAEEVAVVPDGQIAFRINDRADCTARMEMGSIVYENDRGTVAYQAGGVWKETGDDSPAVGDTDDSLDGDDISNEYVVRITNSQVVVEEADDDDS